MRGTESVGKGAERSFHGELGGVRDLRLRAPTERGISLVDPPVTQVRGPFIKGARRSARCVKNIAAPSDSFVMRSSRDLFFPAMIPEPDYSDSEDEREQQRRRPPVRMPGMAAAHPHHNEAQLAHVNDEGLIVPRKLPNPCAESAERKSLHRELLFNQKMGKSVLGQKSELQRAMEKMKDEQRRKELEEERVKGRTALEKRLEEQANKLKLHEETEVIKTDLPSSEESEFLRVHARVCSHTLPVDSKS
ncbi:uncharacterized protein LOC119174680 isoform X2 [Rhipicephalus microplus]